jgi:hypothetical protein
MVSVVIHSNPGLANQVESAGWLSEGLARHGVENVITADKHAEADIHIIQGPWYAYNEWLGKPNVLFLNRCFYGDARFDVSIGWLRPDGSRDFKNHGRASANGVLPKLRPKKSRRRSAVVFADYGKDPTEMIADARRKYDSVFFRPHPAQARETPVMTLKGELSTTWDIADVAIGGTSTVLVEAVINGLHVETTDPLHVVAGLTDRRQWLIDLSWSQWHYDQLKRGDFWEHLCCN